MNIKTESIDDISNQFKTFCSMLQGTNYSVSIICKKFQFQGTNPTIKNIEELFPDEKDNINGILQHISYPQLKSEISHCISYKGHNSGHIGISNDPLEIEKRNKIFWQIIGKYINMPPNNIYKHIPNSSSFFGSAIFWFLCYFLLSSNGNGLFIFAESFD